MRFKEFDLTVYGINPPKIVLRWEIERTVRDLRQYDIYIYRGENQDSMLVIKGPINAASTRQYVDFSVNLTHPNREIYYQVELRHRVSKQSVFSTKETWRDNPDVLGLYVIEEHDFLFQDTIGMPCIYLQRRREGDYCTECFDETTKKRTKDFCEVCYGTSFLGGYYDGTEAWIDFKPSPKLLEQTNWGPTEPNQTDVWLSNYPNLTVQDVILELPSHKRWRVMRVTETEKRRCPMLQMARVTEINHTDIEYKIPYDEAMATRLLARLRERKDDREF